jgi:ATP synthase protein I
MAIDDTSRPDSRAERWNDEGDAADAPAPRPLTREEAEALRRKHPPLSPWRVVAMQGVAGVGLALLALLFTRQVQVAWSALYGAAVVVLPAALMARGMTGRLAGRSPAGAAAGFLFWEMVKIGAAVLLLALAPAVVRDLSWLALLVGLVVCLKVYWLALLWRGR